MLIIYSKCEVSIFTAGIIQISGGLILLLYYHTCYRKMSLHHEKSSEEINDNPAGYMEHSNIVLTIPTDSVQPSESESFCEVATVA